MKTVRDHLTDVDAKLRRRLEVRAASPLSSDDVNYVIDILVMRTALLYDLLDGSTQAGFPATWERTILGLTVLDVELYARDWKTLRQCLTSLDFRSKFYPDAEAAAKAFKELAATSVHYKWTLNSAVAVMEGDDWYKKVNQWVVFDARANLISLDLSDECCAEYLTFESSLVSPDYWLNELESGSDEELCRILRTLRMSARDLVGAFDPTDYAFRPAHGNGATAEVERSQADPWHKNREFAVDSDIINYLKYRVRAKDWRSSLYYPYDGVCRVSRLQCVPKSMTKNRTISAEPTTLQFLQQDLSLALDEFFQSSRIPVNLHNQERSRELACEGSFDGSYATIDLSSASDSVTLGIINLLFDGLPILYPLLATRSTQVHVRSETGSIDTVLETRKFAPMGSALCFPVECIVFCTICEAAIRLQAGRKSRHNDYVVYGDDIVIRTEYAAGAARLLELLKFQVNQDKSFGVDGALDGANLPLRFREACGVEALNGVDITPLRLSRRLVSLTQNNSDHQAGLGVGMVDLLNRAYLRGYHYLRQFVSQKLNSHKWYRTALRVSISDYTEVQSAIVAKRPSWVTVAVPFVIVDDSTDTQWKAFKAGFDTNLFRSSVMVTTATSRKGKYPDSAMGVFGISPSTQAIVPIDDYRAGRPHDSNDFFTWCYKAARRDAVVDEEDLIVDDTGIVTIRPRDLKWSQTWVRLQRPARLLAVVHR